MQRREPEGIVIVCDFCGTDWDEVKPMLEGHHGSVLCLDCFKQAFEVMRTQRPVGGLFTCTLCLHEHDEQMPRWTPADRPEAANPIACLCADCVTLAAKTFHKDPDVPWRMPKRE